jgi:ubiquinone biosynthesis protein
MLKRFRAYRAWRVVVALARVLPRYLVLVRRGDAAPQADWDVVHERAADEIRKIALALEGGFTKVAQIGGARADILPQQFIDKLSQFHDALPPRPFESLRPLVEHDLGRALTDIFASVEPEALAAASLAQVHRATLHDGSEVVIKIQYPEIRKLMPLDLVMLRRVAAIAQRLQSRIDIRSMVYEVTRFIQGELDFEQEVRSTKRLREVLATIDIVRVPKVYDEHCGDRVIVLEYLDGIQVTRIAQWEAAGFKRADIARALGEIYGSMIFELGFFHGDPHPGNLLVLRDGRIGLLDFGLCKDLPKGFARDVAQMMVSAMIGDSEASLAAAERLGFDLGAISGAHLRTLMLAMIGDTDSDEGFLDIMSQARIRRIPEDFALVVRTLILLNGLSHRLAPKRRLIQAEMLKHLAAGASYAQAS